MTNRKYSFDETIDRTNTNCAKWDEMNEKYKSDDIIHLGVADMDFKSPQPIIDSFNAVVEHGVFGYTNLNNRFFTSIQKWMKEKHECEVAKDSIVFCPRITISASIAVRCLTSEKDSIIINTPAYTPLKNAITLNNRKVIESKLLLEDGIYKMDFDSLEKQIDHNTKMFILCSPHNPTGRVWSKQELNQLAEFCIKHNLILLSDEIHSDMIAANYKHTSTLSISEELSNRTILCSSITKTFNVPGVDISYMIIPNKEIRKIIEDSIAKLGINNPNIFSVGAVEAAYNYCDDWVEAVNIYIDENDELLKKYFNENMDGFKVLNREGTYLSWIDYRSLNISEEKLEDWFINEAKVSIYNGSTFGEEGRGFIRINLATSRERLLKALQRMGENYHKLIMQASH